MKTKTLKLISKALLVIILVTSVLSLCACDLFNNIFREEDNYKLPRDIQFNSFEEIESRLKSSDTQNQTYILFDLDQEEVVKESKYILSVFVQTKPFEYYWNTAKITGICYFTHNGDEEFEFRMEYLFTQTNISVDENTMFEIKPMILSEDIEKVEEIKLINEYSCHFRYGLYANGTPIMYIRFSCDPIILENNSYDRFAPTCELLLENLVVIK